MVPQNNITRTRSFDKISTKSFKIHKKKFFFATDLAVPLRFQLSKDDFIPKCLLSLQNVLAAYPPPVPNCLFCILQFILDLKLMASFMLSHWNGNGLILSDRWANGESRAGT